MDMCEGSAWTFQTSKDVEGALAAHYSQPDRWERVAACLPQYMSVADIQGYYQQLEEDIRAIEEGSVPLPPYAPMQLSSSAEEAPAAQRPPPVPKKSKVDPSLGGMSAAAAAAAAAERKKGVPWTEEEHKLFLQGLAKFGKGDWRNIARTFVMTRTPTQVASHAQKYFIRLNSLNKKDKRRASIHDITH